MGEEVLHPEVMDQEGEPQDAPPAEDTPENDEATALAEPAEVLLPEERRQKALTLRRRGASYRQIAAALLKEGRVSPKYSEMQAWKDVRYSLRRIIEKLPELARDVIALDLSRLDRLLAGIMPAAENGDLESIHYVLAIMQRRASLLGLDKQPPPAPPPVTVRVSVNVSNPNVVVRAQPLLTGSGPDAGPPGPLSLDRGRDEDWEDGGVRPVDDRADRSG